MKSELYVLVLGLIHCTTLVPATFTSNFAMHSNTNETHHLLF
jgi:hypothetical protein